MRYCTKCGNEILDESAVVCTKCGCLLNSPFIQQETAVMKETKKDGKPLLNTVFHFVFDILLFLFVIFLFWAFMGQNIITWMSDGYYPHVYARPIFDEGMLIFAIVSAVLAFFFGTTSFAITLVQKVRGERLFSSIKRFVIGIIAAVMSIVFYMCYYN